MMQQGFRKLACDISQEELNLIDQAATVENRTRANFTRTHLVHKAREILEEKKNDDATITNPAR